MHVCRVRQPTSLRQEDIHQAEARKSALQEIRAHESCEPEEIRADEQRTALNPECQGNQHERSGDNSNHAIGVHSISLLNVFAN